MTKKKPAKKAMSREALKGTKGGAVDSFKPTASTPTLQERVTFSFNKIEIQD